MVPLYPQKVSRSTAICILRGAALRQRSQRASALNEPLNLELLNPELEADMSTPHSMIRGESGNETLLVTEIVASFPGSSAPERDIEVVHAEYISRSGEPGTRLRKSYDRAVWPRLHIKHRSSDSIPRS